MFSAYEIAVLQADAATARDGLATFKNLKGEAQNEQPIPCAVSSDNSKRDPEIQQGARTTVVTHWKIKIETGIEVKATWRVSVVFPGGEKAEYHVNAVLGPKSNQSQLVILVTKVE